MGHNAIETILGAVVLVVAGLFLTFAYNSAEVQKIDGYTVFARFPMVDGLKEGTDVRINGVKVGSVAQLDLITKPGPNQFFVDVQLTVKSEIDLPMDTVAMAAMESLLGGRYLALEVGVEDNTVAKDGTGRITQTQAPVRLDDLIGQLIYSSSSSSKTAVPADAATAGTEIIQQ